tara:strand:- start:31 stop:483 length:453 start_codon:yes stop_codon:yes gene_type:complete
MTKFAFYQLDRMPLDRALPQLLNKVIAQNCRVLVRTRTEEELNHLNRLLWTYDADSFLPHGTSSDGFDSEQPIYLTTSDVNPNYASVEVLVGGAGHSRKGNFERTLDLFEGDDPNARAAATKRRRSLSVAGESVTFWRQSIDGVWKREDG